MLKTKDGSFHTADIVLNSFILKPENVTLSKMCDFNLLFFKMYLYNSNFQPISCRDLNINLGALNGFSATSAKVAINTLE